MSAGEGPRRPPSRSRRSGARGLRTVPAPTYTSGFAMKARRQSWEQKCSRSAPCRRTSASLARTGMPQTGVPRGRGHASSPPGRAPVRSEQQLAARYHSPHDAIIVQPDIRLRARRSDRAAEQSRDAPRPSTRELGERGPAYGSGRLRRVLAVRAAENVKLWPAQRSQGQRAA